MDTHFRTYIPTDTPKLALPHAVPSLVPSQHARAAHYPHDHPLPGRLGLDWAATTTSAKGEPE
jgi:hypothetical protein